MLPCLFAYEINNRKSYNTLSLSMSIFEYKQNTVKGKEGVSMIYWVFRLDRGFEAFIHQSKQIRKDLLFACF